MSEAARLHILDGHGYIFRAHYGLATGGKDRQPVRLNTSAGMPTGALYVYASMLIRLHLDVRPQRIAVVFDSGRRSFRSDIDAGYKATRNEAPDDLRVQLPYFRPLTEAFCWPCMSVEGVEADDVIATLVERARARDWDVVIYSGDKDLMTLVDDHVVVIDSMRQITYDAAGVEKKFGVAPALVSEFLSLVGDTSDNIPGVSGIGPVTAARLLGQYGSVDAILAHVDELKGKVKERLTDPAELDKLARSRLLVALKRDVDVPAELDDLVPRPWNGEPLRRLCEELEFQALIERLEQKTVEQEIAQAGLTPGQGAAPELSDPAMQPVFITRAEQVGELAAAAAAARRMAIHVERDGQREDRTTMIGLAVAVPGRAPAYIPLQHRYLSAPAQLAIADLRPLADVWGDPSVQVVCHDAKAVYKVLGACEMQIGGTAEDTMLAAYLLDASQDEFRLEQVAKDVLGVSLTGQRALLGSGRTAIGFEGVSVEDAARHAGRSAGAVLAAGRVLVERLRAGGLEGLWRDLELPLAHLLARVEATGIRIDVPHLRGLADRVSQDLAALEQKIQELAGEPVNLGSPRQLGALLFEKLGLRSERMKKLKTGYSVDHEVLEVMRDLHPIIGPILEHRELIKLKNTYIDALPPLINPATGRLHTSFRQAVAATGRLSSTEPNLQNIPIRSDLGREIRRAFIAEPGKVLVSADYSQIELRILAHLSGDPVLRRAFAEGVDVHAQTAAEVFGIPLEEVGPRERRVAKAVNYGLAYGQSDFGLARAIDVPRAEARHYIDRYFERFATVRQFMDGLVEKARRTGAAVTVLGRRRPIPGLGARDYRLRSAAERVAQNTPMQGSGADIMKLAMLRVDRLLARCGFRAELLLTVHDELVLEVDVDQADELSPLLVAEMEGAYQLDVPLVVEVRSGASWADAH
ncbi:MAG TPA: DNA polymerase I [Candidatus Acidoferrum sp.]|nr:DNA polymerase I [Candidatus Acidoferrum sp.]